MSKKIEVDIEVTVVTTYKQKVRMTRKKYNILRDRVKKSCDGQEDMLEVPYEIYTKEIDQTNFDSVDIEVNKIEEVQPE
jgi:hypothetical protein